MKISLIALITQHLLHHGETQRATEQRRIPRLIRQTGLRSDIIRSYITLG